MIKAVVASEDQRFFEHHGFDFRAIGQAARVNWRGYRKVGASTISQQTAKNVFLWPQRSWLRKGLEVYFTALIEIFWGKERILEVYLNVFETGRGIYGVEKASWQYYGHSSTSMVPEEAALLAACVPNPRHWTPLSPPPSVVRRRNWIVRQMQFLHLPDIKKAND